MDFSQINKIGKVSEFLPTKKLSDLTIGTDYRITGVRNVQTKYGPRITIDVNDELTCFLPQRFVKAFEENTALFHQMVAAARDNNLLMNYQGTKFNNLEFKPANP